MNCLCLLFTFQSWSKQTHQLLNELLTFVVSSKFREQDCDWLVSRLPAARKKTKRQRFFLVTNDGKEAQQRPSHSHSHSRQRKCCAPTALYLRSENARSRAPPSTDSVTRFIKIVTSCHPSAGIKFRKIQPSNEMTSQ